MDKEYKPFEFDSPATERSKRIEREVEILPPSPTSEIWEEGAEEEGQREGAREGAAAGQSERAAAGQSEGAGDGIRGRSITENQRGATRPTEKTPEQIEAEREAEERRLKRESSIFWQFISGNWLILDGVAESYRYLLIIATTLFLSVVSIYATYHLSEKLTLHSEHAQLLRERSLEYQRIRFNNTSHSAIVKELERRKIPLYDLHESKTVIE